MKTVRIGGGAACAEDRVDHAVDMIERGNLDYVIFDSLSENELSQVTIKSCRIRACLDTIYSLKSG